jgi:threonine dehydrogenase-like Zn-dependent dehydrogenase
MLAAKKTGPEHAEIVQVSLPRPAPDGVLVRVKACAICASDIPGWRSPVNGSGIQGEWDFDNPGLTGHEVAGEIVAVGSAANAGRIGERVWIDPIAGCGQCPECRSGRQTFCANVFIVCQGFAEFAVAPSRQCRPIPAGMDFTVASLIADMAGTPIGAVKRAALTNGESVAVWGLGPVGLGIVQAAIMVGASPVIGIDPVASRRHRAERHGAVSLDPLDRGLEETIRDLTGGKGPDVVLSTVASQEASRVAYETLKDDGRMVTVAGFPPAGGETRKWVSGTWGCDERHWPEVLEAIASGRFRLDEYITHMFPLAHIEQAFSVRADDLAGSFKVVVTNE